MSSQLLALAHIVGLALGVGAATVKLVLLLRCRSDPARIAAFLEVSGAITRIIIVGLVLLTLSGVARMYPGFSFTPPLAAKSALVLLLWILGPCIDKVIEPAFVKFAPRTGEPVSAAFLQAQNRYWAAEVAATGLFYVITVLGMLL
jgi:hypothetical protein